MNVHKIIKTEDLIKQRASGTISEKNDFLLSKRLDLEVELNRASNYTKYFKSYCVIRNCKNSIPKDWGHFQYYGNYCQDCRTRINKLPLKNMTEFYTNINALMT